MLVVELDIEGLSMLVDVVIFMRLSVRLVTMDTVVVFVVLDRLSTPVVIIVKVDVLAVLSVA